MLKPEYFEDQESYEAFKYAEKVVSKLPKDTILMDKWQNPYNTNKIEVVHNGKDSFVAIDGTWIVGDTHELEEGRIYCRIAEVKEFFEESQLSVMQPLNLGDIL